jgi:glutamate racemase
MSDRDPNDSLPIAVFDSGVGGLTVLHECLVSLPQEDYV